MIKFLMENGIFILTGVLLSYAGLTISNWQWWVWVTVIIIGIAAHDLVK